MQKKWKFLLPRMLQDKYRNCCKFLAFFLQIGLHFSCIFGILILAIKMDLHFLHYFCIFLHPDFWGSIFQLHLFCIFSPKYLFYCFPIRGTARPHNPSNWAWSYHRLKGGNSTIKVRGPLQNTGPGVPATLRQTGTINHMAASVLQLSLLQNSVAGTAKLGGGCTTIAVLQQRSWRPHLAPDEATPPHFLALTCRDRALASVLALTYQPAHQQLGEDHVKTCTPPRLIKGKHLETYKTPGSVSGPQFQPQFGREQVMKDLANSKVRKLETSPIFYRE